MFEADSEPTEGIKAKRTLRLRKNFCLRLSKFFRFSCV